MFYLAEPLPRLTSLLVVTQKVMSKALPKPPNKLEKITANISRLTLIMTFLMLCPMGVIGNSAKVMAVVIQSVRVRSVHLHDIEGHTMSV